MLILSPSSHKSLNWGKLVYLSENESISKIKKFFTSSDKIYIYGNQRRNTVTCKMIEDGITVDCLADGGFKNFLPWGVFWQAVHIMLVSKGKVKRGSAMHRLGSVELPFKSIEGHIANVLYGKKEGDSVFRRVSPIAHILIASGICIEQRGDMKLVLQRNSPNG
jgi:hypothetical protein